MRGGGGVTRDAVAPATLHGGRPRLDCAFAHPPEDRTLTAIEIPLETSGQFRLRVEATEAGTCRVGLRSTEGHDRSPLLRTLRTLLAFRLPSPTAPLRLPELGDDLELPARFDVVLGDGEQCLARLLPGEDGPAVTSHDPLGPVEARFLADNGFPHPHPGGSLAGFRPRTDLHTHFAGCGRPADLLQLGLDHDVAYAHRTLEAAGIRIPGDDPVRLADLPGPARARIASLLAAPIDHQITYTEMQGIYRARRPILKCPEAFVPLCDRFATDYGAMGAERVELSLFDIAESDRLREAHDRLPEIEARTGVALRFLAAMNRHDEVEWDLDYIERIGDLGRSRFIAGVDFMGRESNSTREFLPQIEAVARWAHEHRPGFVVRVHAGESPAHPENVRVAAEAVRGFDVQLRIGHGLYGTDARTLDALLEVGAIVEFNLGSNYALNNVQMTTEAPLFTYLDAGVPVVLATDGYGIYHTSLPLEARAAALAGLTEAHFARIAETEARYLAERATHEAQWTDAPEAFAIPAPRPPVHYHAGLEREKAARRDATRAALRARLDAAGAVRIDGDALASLLGARRCLAFSGAWRRSWERLGPEGQQRVRAWVEALLDALDPADVLLVTGGSGDGLEGCVQTAARARGFDVLGVLVEASPPDALRDGDLSHAAIVAETLYEKSAALYRLLQQADALCLFVGGGNIVSDEIQAAHNLRVPYLLFADVPGASGEQARLRPHLAVREASEVLDRLARPRWDSREGRYYHLGANPTVDGLILRRAASGEREILLVRRADTAATEAGRWALPGGFHHTDAPRGTPWRAGAETAVEACVREVREETHLDLSPVADQLTHLGNFEGGGRDPRDTAESWSRAQLFGVELPAALADAEIVGSDDAVDARWFPLDGLPPRLAFDHARIIEIGLERFGG